MFHFVNIINVLFLIVISQVHCVNSINWINNLINVLYLSHLIKRMTIGKLLIAREGFSIVFWVLPPISLSVFPTQGHTKIGLLYYFSAYIIALLIIKYITERKLQKSYVYFH